MDLKAWQGEPSLGEYHGIQSHSQVIFHCKFENWHVFAYDITWKKLMVNQIWLEENNHYICEIWKFKFKCNDCYIEICYELWNFKLRITLSRELYCTFFLKILSIFHYKRKSLQWFPICFNEICIKRFAENGHFAEEIWQKQTRVELNIASMLGSTQENKIF